MKSPFTLINSTPAASNTDWQEMMPNNVDDVDKNRWDTNEISNLSQKFLDFSKFFLVP